MASLPAGQGTDVADHSCKWVKRPRAGDANAIDFAVSIDAFLQHSLHAIDGVAETAPGIGWTLTSVKDCSVVAHDACGNLGPPYVYRSDLSHACRLPG